MKNFLQFFQDDTGALSCMRLITFLVIVVVLFVWAYCNIVSGQFTSMGYSEAGIITTAIGGKAVQSRFEYGAPTAQGPCGYPNPSIEDEHDVGSN